MFHCEGDLYPAYCMLDGPIQQIQVSIVADSGVAGVEVV
jgi:hypothetical protein